MRALIFAAAFAVVGCAAQLQVVGPYAGQLSQSDIRQITALMPPDETISISHTYTKLDVVRRNQVHVTVGGFALDTHGVATSDPSNYSFTAVKRGYIWATTGEVELERRLTVY